MWAASALGAEITAWNESKDVGSSSADTWIEATPARLELNTAETKPPTTVFLTTAEPDPSQSPNVVAKFTAVVGAGASTVTKIPLVTVTVAPAASAVSASLAMRVSVLAVTPAPAIV